jgi:hypothetical protein
MAHICPVCGYDGLEEPPYDDKGNPSHEICSCCGFEFGYDDESEGFSFSAYRNKWLSEGAEWFNPAHKPAVCSLEEQLRRFGVNGYPVYRVRHGRVHTENPRTCTVRGFSVCTRPCLTR